MINFIRVLKADISFFQAIAMLTRRTINSRVAKALQIIKENNLPITPLQIESHYLAGGNVLDIVQACTELNKRQVYYDINELFAIDLSRGNIAKLIESFLSASTEFTALELREFLRRFWLGEDVVEKVRNADACRE